MTPRPDRQTLVRLLLISAAVWLTIGVLSGIQVYFFQLGVDRPVSLRLAVWAQVLAAVPWIPTTPVIVQLARRLPFVEGQRIVALAGHLLAGILFVVVVNMAQAVLQFGVGCPIGCAETILSQFSDGILQWGHYGFLAYGMIVAFSWWRQSREGPTVEPQSSTYRTSLTVTVGRTRQVIRVCDVEWIEASGDYTLLHIDGQSKLCTMRLGELEAVLDPAEFARIHRSAMVNLSRVREYAPRSHGDYSLIMDSGKDLKLTRNRRQDVLERLKSGVNGL